MLARLTLKESQKIDDLPVLATCQSATLAMFSSKVNSLASQPFCSSESRDYKVNCPVAHGSTR